MKKTILILWILAFFTIRCNAQVSFSTYLTNTVYAFNDTFKLDKNDVFTIYKSQFNLTPDDQMVLDKSQFYKVDTTDTIDNGSVQWSYKQYYKGYEVEGKRMNLLTKCSVVLYVSGSVVPNLNINTGAIALSEEDALANILDSINAPLGYPWEDTALENNIKIERDDPNASSYPHAQLVIAKKYGSGYADVTDNYALCYKFPITYFDSLQVDSIWVDSVFVDTSVTLKIIKNRYVYVNALTGNIWSNYDPSNGDYYTTGDVWTWYDGHRYDIETRTCTFCSNYSLIDGRNIHTLAFPNNSVDFKVVKKGNNSWVSDNEKEPATEHWAIERAYDFFMTKHGLSYPSGNVIGVFANSTIATGALAKWSPPLPYFGHTGDDIIFVQPGGAGNSSVATLDIMGHEFTHAMNHKYGNIGQGYSISEQQALNEGFADIFGMLSETYYNGWCDLEWGEDYNYASKKRRFNDPFNDNPPSATNYNDANMYNAGQYSASGPLRRWWDHLSQGEWDWTPPYSGMGPEDAGRLALITWAWWEWPGSDYASTMRASLAVADIHYGGFCRSKWKITERSWYDVGVLNHLVNCQVVVLRTGRVVNINDVSTIANHPIRFVIEPTFTDNDNPTAVAITGYNWLLPSGWSGSLSNNDATFTLTNVPNANSAVVKVAVSYTEYGNPETKVDTVSSVVHFCTECNDSTIGMINSLAISPITKKASPMTVTIFPNPVTNYINIDLPSDYKTTQMGLFDITGKELYKTTIVGGHNIIHIPKLASGIYIVRLKNSTLNFVKQIVAQ